MWLLAYWWQALILIILFGFLVLIFKELIKERFSEPAAIFLVIEGHLDFNSHQLKSGQALVLYQNEQVKFQGHRLFVKNGDLYLEHSANIKKIMPGEVFEFAGITLQLMRWDNARQFINQYRISPEGQ